MIGLSPAEKVLRNLGITEPSEIDLEAIAWHLGARIRTCPLDGCEARIIGHKDRAIIRVSDRSGPRRKRFSIGHELGHWHHHRDRTLVCRPDDIGNRSQGASRLEKIADQYAADLILPRYLFDPLAKQCKRMTLANIRSLADAFDVSLTATAIRMVEGRHSPAILVCHGQRGRKWFLRSPDVPDRWFPQGELDPDSFAFGLMFGDGKEEAYPRLMGAAAWFDRDEAKRYELHEQSFRAGESEVLTVLLITDEGMLEDWGTGSNYGRYDRR